MELALALDKLNDPEIIVQLLTQTFRGRVPCRIDNLRSNNLLWPIGPRFDWLREYSPLLELAAPHDLLHIPYNFARVHRPECTVATIHDAMFFSHPEDAFGHAFARQEAPKFARSCRAIAAPSLSAKADIVKYLGVPSKKVTVIPWGVDRSLFNAADKAGAGARVAVFTGSQRPYFLAVSCSSGRKNTISVLRAYRDALKGGLEHDLLLVWGSPPASYLHEFAEAIAARRIRFLRHVDDALLGDLYAGATATFFPSRYEGFGLPILESMACGTPVVTCANSSLQEVGGTVAIYVDPNGVDDMRDYMRLFDTGASPGDGHDAAACLAQAGRFTWREAAVSYLSFYRRHAKD